MEIKEIKNGLQVKVRLMHDNITDPTTRDLQRSGDKLFLSLLLLLAIYGSLHTIPQLLRAKSVFESILITFQMKMNG